MNLFRALVAVALFVPLLGCGDKTASSGPKPMAATAFRGAKFRVLNLSSSAADTTLNGLPFVPGVEAGTATPFRLTPTKDPLKVEIHGADGVKEFSVPVEKGSNYTLVFDGSDVPVIIEGEPTDVEQSKSALFYCSLGPEEAASISILPSTGAQFSILNKESKRVEAGSYTASVDIGGGKQATTTVDLKGGHSISFILIGSGAERKLLAIKNHPEMRAVVGGASPAG